MTCALTRPQRAAHNRAEFESDPRQATTLARVAYCTMALVVSAAEMLDAIDARKARVCH